MGAISTVLIIWGLIVYIFYEAIDRILNLDSFTINGEVMLICACIGLAFNVTNLVILNYCFNEEEEEEEEQSGSRKKEDLNVRAAIIHLIGDGVQAVGVLIAAILIYINPEWKIADPITAFVFTVIVLGVTIPVFIDCVKMLLESAPGDIDMVDLYNSLHEVSLFDLIFSSNASKKCTISTAGTCQGIRSRLQPTSRRHKMLPKHSLL